MGPDHTRADAPEPPDGAQRARARVATGSTVVALGILGAFPRNHDVIVGASALLVLLGLVFVAVLAVKTRAAAARIQRARPGVVVVPGWASEVTLARLGSRAGVAGKSARSWTAARHGRRPRGLRVAFVLTDDSLELWRMTPASHLLAVPWAQTVGTEVRAQVLGLVTRTVLVVHLTDGSELGIQPLEPWAGGPPRDTHDTVAHGYVDHLASRVRATRERAVTS